MIRPTSRGVIGYSNENHDCTVSAATNASGYDYSMVHSALRYYGRPDKRGAVIRTIAKAYTELGFKLYGVFGTSQTALHELEQLQHVFGESNVKHCVGITLKRFIESNIKGSFVCINRNHAFAVIDGKLIDARSIKEGTYITCIFKFV